MTTETTPDLSRWLEPIPASVSVGTSRETAPWPRVEPPAKIPHRWTVVEQLRDLPDLATHLAARLTTRAPGGETGGGKRDPAHLAPVNLAILHALDDRPRYPGDDQMKAREEERWRCQHHGHDPARCPTNLALDDDGRQGALADLAMWARMIHADLDGYHPQPQPLPDHTWAAICAWLHHHLDTWTHAYPDEAREFERDLTGWHTAMRRELGETDPVRLRHRYGDQACGHEILQRTDSLFQCRGCMQTWSLVEMMRQARWHSDVTLAEAADQTGIKLGTLKQWVKRGKLQPVDNRRPARYRLRDIRDLADDTRHAS